MLAVKNCIFLNNTWSVLQLEYSSAYVTNSVFISNSGGPVYLTINGTSQMYSAGGAVTLHSLSNIVLKNCLFRLNIADVGGVVYAKHWSNLTFINCNFVGNCARKLGGVLYSEKFCIVSIFNSSFCNSSAVEKGGVFTVAETNLIIDICVLFLIVNPKKEL